MKFSDKKRVFFKSKGTGELPMLTLSHSLLKVNNKLIKSILKNTNFNSFFKEHDMENFKYSIFRIKNLSNQIESSKVSFFKKKTTKLANYQSYQTHSFDGNNKPIKDNFSNLSIFNKRA